MTQTTHEFFTRARGELAVMYERSELLRDDTRDFEHSASTWLNDYAEALHALVIEGMLVINDLLAQSLMPADVRASIERHPSRPRRPHLHLLPGGDS